MSRRYTQTEKTRGELAVRDLSAKARDAYYGADPLSVFELDTDEGTRYDVRGMFDADRLTFEELQKALEDYADALEEY